MSALFSRQTVRILGGTLTTAAIPALLFGVVAALLLHKSIWLPAAFSVACGAVVALVGMGVAALLAWCGAPARVRSVLTVIVFALTGPLLVGFVTAFTARHTGGGPALVAQAGLVGVGPLVMAILQGVVGWSHIRRLR